MRRLAARVLVARFVVVTMTLAATAATAGAAATNATDAVHTKARVRVVPGALTLATPTGWTMTEGRTCEGSGLYGDVGRGTPVVVRDLAGHVLLRTSLRGGVRHAGCRFAFVLRRLPSARIYGIVIGPQTNIVYQDGFTSDDRRLVHGGLEFVIGRPAPVPGA